MPAHEALNADQIGALANAAIGDRLTGFGSNSSSPVGKNGSHITRFLASTEAEDAWDAVIGPQPPPPPTRDVHPAIAALALKMKSQRR